MPRLTTISILFLISCAPIEERDAGPNPDVNELDTQPVFTEIASSLDARWGSYVAGDDDQAFLFAGNNLSDFGGEIFSDFYEIDTLTGAFSTREIEGLPTGRYCGCAAFDASTNKMLVAGGRLRSGPVDEYFIIDLDDDRARPIDISLNGGQLGCAAASHEGIAYIFGGGSQIGVTDRLYAFDFEDETITELPSPVLPSARYDASMVYADGALYMFGGTSNPQSPQFYPGDFWRYSLDDQRWVQLSENLLSGRREPWMRSDRNGGIIIGFGSFGLGLREARSDVIRYDIATDSVETMLFDASPGARGFSPPIPAAPPAIGFVFGGTDLETIYDDMWVLGLE